MLLILARQHRVGLRAGGHQDRARRQHLFVRTAFSRRETAWPSACPKRSISTAAGRQTFGEAHALFDRLGDFLVVERVARRIDRAGGGRRSSPRPTTSSNCASRWPRGLRPAPPALGADGARVRQKLRRDFALLGGPGFRAPPPRRARRPAFRSASGTSRPGVCSRPALRSPCRSRSGRRRSRPPAGEAADWRSIAFFAAPVSCSAIRKSEAMRTPRARPLGIAICVGLPAPAHSAMWSKPSVERILDGDRAAEAHAAIHRELRAAAPAAGG